MEVEQSNVSNTSLTSNSNPSECNVTMKDTNVNVESEVLRNVSRFKRMGNQNAEIVYAEWSRLAIDNGAYEVKMGWPSRVTTAPLTRPTRIIPNTIAKVKSGIKRRLVGEEIDTHPAPLSGAVFRRPFDRGYILNWEMQREIWNLEHTYKLFNQKFDAANVDLVLSEAVFTPERLRRVSYEVLFEDIAFRSVFVSSAPHFALYHTLATTHDTLPLSQSPCHLIVDSGYSFTHILPFFDRHLLNHAVKRVNVGGKLLTNYLKEIVSYRYYNVMEETYLMNIIKEKCCFVSQNFLHDLSLAKRRDKSNIIRCEYVLPDFKTNRFGWIRGEEPPPHDYPENIKQQVLVLNNERITVPEVLFNPSDIGLEQMGIVEAIVESIRSCPPELQEPLYGNVILIGGNVLLRGFKERVESELRQLAPVDFPVRVVTPEDPVIAAWCGAALYASSALLPQLAVTRREWDEFGFTICKRKFIVS